MIQKRETPPPALPAAVKQVTAEALFADAREIQIRFRGETYRLRITRNDKLILTK